MRITEQLNDKNRIFGLDLMRAAAILMVLLAHCSWIFKDNGGFFSQILALSGFLGVEIFFVLSGFLIGRILFREFTSGNFSLKDAIRFLKRRWLRTLPNYFLVLTLNIAIAMLIGYEIPYVWKYFLFLQNFASPLLPFFPESWSLAVEEFAYLLLPLLLFLTVCIFPRAVKPKLFLWSSISMIAICIVAKLLYHNSTMNTDLSKWNIGLKSVVIYRLDAIFIGVVFGWLYCVKREFWIRRKLYFLACGFLMVGFFTAGIGYFQLLIDSHPFFWNVAYLPLASLSAALFLPFLSEWKSFGSFGKLVTFISLISYSIYLLHYSIVLQSLKQVTDTENLSFPMQLVFTGIYILITILLSTLLYRFYEKPVMDLRDRKPAIQS